MSLIDFVAVAVWPVVGSGVLIFWFAACDRTRLSEERRWAIIGFAGLLFFLPLIVLARYNSHSHLTFALWQFFYIFCGLLFLSLLTLVVRAHKNLSRIRLVLLALIVLVIGAPFLASGIWNLAGDYVVDRERVEGVIEDTQVIVGRSGPRFRVMVNGRNFLTTEGAFENLSKGDHIQVETGIGTGMIYRLKRMSAN